VTLTNAHVICHFIQYVAPNGDDLILQSKPDLLNGANLNLNSFASHTFQVREMPGKISGVCAGEDQQCRSQTFTVNTNENQGKFNTIIIHLKYANCLLASHSRSRDFSLSNLQSSSSCPTSK